MIPILLSLPGRIKTLLDRITTARMSKIDEITPTRMGYLDSSISSRAPASTALSTTIWTSGRAELLDQVFPARMQQLDQIYQDRLTNQRASNLDQISSSRMAKIDSLESRLTSNRASALDSINKTLREQIFYSSGTWAIRSGVTEVWVEVVGGGGGGGSTSISTAYNPGGGGGSGGRSYGSVPVANDVSVWVGAGGTSDVDGNESSFLTVKAGGGRRGKRFTYSQSDGGAAFGGSPGIGGSSGETAVYRGAVSGAGGGGVGIGGTERSTSGPGNNATANTGGGGGGGFGTNQLGGSGAAGYVRVVWRE